MKGKEKTDRMKAEIADYDGELKRLRAQIESGIERWLPPADAPPPRLHAAMRYAMQAGGKRLRPILVVAASELFKPSKGAADPLAAAVAVECVHIYSLIH